MVDEIISGDRREDIAAVWARLDQADWYASAMLEGGQNPQGTFFPLDDIEAVRRIVKDLRPSVLDVLGILPTISSVIEGFQKTHSDIRIEKDIAVEENEIKVSLKTVIFRILQEALSNIAKHSRADHARLRLKKSADRLELIIEDNGVGFDVSQTFLSEFSERGVGLASMRERTELSEGTFVIKSDNVNGTIISASWPL